MRLKQDNVYGVQVLTHWSGYELLGIRDKPVGTDFDFKLDFLNKRGFGYGGAFTYDRPDLFVFSQRGADAPGPAPEAPGPRPRGGAVRKAARKGTRRRR